MGEFNRDGGSDRRHSGGFRRRDFGRGKPGRGHSGGFDRRGSERDRYSERHEMHSGICDKCGNDCEVPFKPTQGKPLYCDKCFKEKSREAGSKSGFGKPSNDQFDQLSKKLDRILSILESGKKPAEDKTEWQPKSEKPNKKEKNIPDLETSNKKEKTAEAAAELPDLEEPQIIEEKKPKKKKSKKKKS